MNLSLGIFQLPFWSSKSFYPGSCLTYLSARSSSAAAKQAGAFAEVGTTPDTVHGWISIKHALRTRLHRLHARCNSDRLVASNTEYLLGLSLLPRPEGFHTAFIDPSTYKRAPADVVQMTIAFVRSWLRVSLHPPPRRVLTVEAVPSIDNTRSLMVAWDSHVRGGMYA